MDQAAKDRIQREIEDDVRTLLPAGACAGWSGQSHSDDPHFEPGELLPSLILTEPPGRRRGRPEPGAGNQEVPERPRPGTQAVPARPGPAVA